MNHKLKFWHHRRNHSPRPRRKSVSRRRSLRESFLGAERLEDRHMLSAGSLDASFNASGAVPGTLISDLGFIESGEAVAVQADGKILIAGTIDPPGAPTQDFGVARYHADGQLDTTFGINDLDGVDGLATADFFGGSDIVFDMLIDSQGRIVVVGQGRTSSGSSGIGVVRFDADGNLDTSFDGDGKNLVPISGFVVEPEAVAEQADGKLVVAGSRRSGGSSTNDFLVARFNADGSLDTSFNGVGFRATDFSGSLDEIYDVAVQADGKIVVGGQARVSSNSAFGLARYNTDGSLDPTFGTGGLVHQNIVGLEGPSPVSDLIRSIAVQADGKIVVVGDIATSNGQADGVVARFLADGSLDPDFNASGVQPGALRVHVSTADFLHSLVVQPDGNYVAVGATVTGSDDSLLAVRILESGQLDPSFGTGGIVVTNLIGDSTDEGYRGVVIQPGGMIVAGGHFGTDFLLARYESGLAVAPSISGEAEVDEGATYTLDLSSGDPTTSQWTINWGDNTEIVTGNPTSVTHVYADDTAGSTYTISATATTSTGTVAAGNTVSVTVNNVAPTLDISGAADVNEGAVYTLNLSSSDPGADTISQWTINWGDGTEIITGNPTSVTHTYADGDASYVISATATDEDGTFAAGNTVSVMVHNVAPTLTISGAADVDEAGVYTLNLSSSDPGVDTITSWTINWGDGIEVVAGNPTSVTHTYADGDASYVISATATDDDGTFAAGNSVDVTVHNVAPSLAISGAADVDEGAVYTLNLSSSDQGDDTITSWTINWGDGTEIITGHPASVTHTYADDTGSSTYTISATATDEDGTFAAGNTVSVTVNNVAPTADDASFSVVENSANGTIVGSVTATDPGDDSLSFSIVGGSGAAAFAVDGSTGEITVANSSLLDYENSPVLTLEIEVADGDGGFDMAAITIELVNLASISGVVFVDVNQNGLYDANEPGIDGVVIELLDEFGDPVLDSQGEAITAITSSGGFYLFEDLDPGTYQLFQVQPTGVDDGPEELGSLGGTIIGNDRMQLALAETDAFDYAFSELGQQLTSGDTAGIGFWQNKHGQSLITQGGSALANWLSSNFPNVFGNELAGASGSDVASFYRDQLFKQKGKKSAGPAKVDAQFMAVAMATFFTNQNMAGLVAASYGFNVTDTGIGTKIVNVGTNGAAFNVADGSDQTILQLLLATNDLTDQPDELTGYAKIYDTDGDGEISSSEASLRTMANSLFSMINEAGGI